MAPLARCCRALRLSCPSVANSCESVRKGWWSTRRLVAVMAFIASTAVADELHSVDPKTVIDGTFYVSVRLLGVDAPERGDRAKCDQERALSKRSTERVKELLHGQVTLDVHGVDEFGRLLANVRLSDGRDLGEVLLRENLPDPIKPDSIRTGADCSSQFRLSVARLFRLRRWPYWTITELPAAAVA
jgi:nuclease-like protein